MSNSNSNIQGVNIEYLFGPVEPVKSIHEIENFVVTIHNTCIAVFRPELARCVAIWQAPVINGASPLLLRIDGCILAVVYAPPRQAAFIDVYDVSTKSGIPTHLHRLRWTNLVRHRRKSSTGTPSSLTVEDLHVVIVDDTVWAGNGTSLRGFVVVEHRRTRRATKRMGKLEKMLGADVIPTPDLSTPDADVASQLVERVARGRAHKVGQSLSEAPQLQMAGAEESMRKGWEAVQEANNSTSRARAAAERRMALATVLPQAPDELPRIATMPSFGPEARAAAAAALAVVLATDETVCQSPLRPDHTLVSPSGAGITCVNIGSGATLACGYDDGTLCLWSASDGALLHELVGHQGPILKMELHESFILSTACDDTARLWETACGTCLNELSLTIDPEEARKERRRRKHSHEHNQSKPTSPRGRTPASPRSRTKHNDVFVPLNDSVDDTPKKDLPAHLVAHYNASADERLAVHVRAATWALEHHNKALLLDQIRYALSALEEAPPTAAVTSFNVPAWLLPATSSGSRSTKTLTSAAQRTRWFLTGAAWALEHNARSLALAQLGAALEAAKKLTADGFDPAVRRGVYHSTRHCTHQRVEVLALQAEQADVVAVHVAANKEILTYDAGTGQLKAKRSSHHPLIAMFTCGGRQQRVIDRPQLAGDVETAMVDLNRSNSKSGVSDIIISAPRPHGAVLPIIGSPYTPNRDRPATFLVCVDAEVCVRVLVPPKRSEKPLRVSANDNSLKSQSKVYLRYDASPCCAAAPLSFASIKSDAVQPLACILTAYGDATLRCWQLTDARNNIASSSIPISLQGLISPRRSHNRVKQQPSLLHSAEKKYNDELKRSSSSSRRKERENKEEKKEKKTHKHNSSAEKTKSIIAEKVDKEGIDKSNVEDQLRMVSLQLQSSLQREALLKAKNDLCEKRIEELEEQLRVALRGVTTTDNNDSNDNTSGVVVPPLNVLSVTRYDEDDESVTEEVLSSTESDEPLPPPTNNDYGEDDSTVEDVSEEFPMREISPPPTQPIARPAEIEVALLGNGRMKHGEQRRLVLTVNDEHGHAVPFDLLLTPHGAPRVRAFIEIAGALRMRLALPVEIDDDCFVVDFAPRHKGVLTVSATIDNENVPCVGDIQHKIDKK